MLWLKAYTAECIQLNPSEIVTKSQPQKRVLSKPDTDFSQPHKLVFEKTSQESTIIKKTGKSKPEFQAIVKSKQSSTIKVEEALSTDNSVTRFTTSATIETETAVSGKIYPPIVPFDVNTRLKNSASLCVAFTEGGKRCSRQAQKSDLVQGSLKVLIMHYGHQDCKSFLSELKTFIHQALCGRSHRKPAVDRIKTLEITIRGDPGKERCREALVHIFGAEDADSFCLWAKAISDLRDPQTQQMSVDKHNTSVENPSISNPVTTGIESRVALSTDPISTSILSTVKMSVATTLCFSGFRPYQPKKTKVLRPNSALRQVVEANLTESDLKSGFIYIFWLKGISFGHLKIGRSNDPHRRIQEWNNRCKHEHVLVEDMVEVPHVSRVERLIHQELKDIRKSMKCAGCKTEHREWFEISESNARRVLKKWQDWIQQHPYEEDQTGKWKLKHSSRTTVADICQPLLLDTKPFEPLGFKKYKSPPVKLMGSKKYKSPRRKVSESHSLEKSADRGLIPNEKDDGLPKHKLPGDGLTLDDKVHHGESAMLRTSNEPSKSEVSRYTLAQATSSLSSKAGDDHKQSTLAATSFKDLSSKCECSASL